MLHGLETRTRRISFNLLLRLKFLTSLFGLYSVFLMLLFRGVTVKASNQKHYAGLYKAAFGDQCKYFILNEITDFPFSRRTSSVLNSPFRYLYRG